MSAPPTIMIFGAAVRPDGRPSPALRRRIGYGMAAAKAYPGSPVICSGGIGRHGPSEASVMVETLLGLGLPRERLIADTASLDTLQSAVFVARSVHAGLGAPVVVCSDDYHLPRIRAMLAVLGVRSVAGPRSSRWPRGHWLHRLGMTLREMVAIVYDVVIVAVRRRSLLS